MEATRGRDNGRLVLGAVLIVVGVVFLLSQFLDIDFGRYGWPFFVILPGLAFFVGMLLGGPGAAGLAVPGSIVTTVGLILLYQNTFDRWETWAYAWTLIVVAAGVGVWISGAWGRRPELRRQGQRVATIGALLFLGFFAFFELVLNLSGFGGGVVTRIAFPVLLIALGVFLLLRRTRAA